MTNLPIIIVVALILGLISYFYKKLLTIKADTLASNEVFKLLDFLENNIIDFVFSVLLLMALIYGVDTSGLITNSDLTNISGAFVTGMGIPASAVAFLSIFKRGDKSRKDLRKVIDEKTNQLEEFLKQ